MSGSRAFWGSLRTWLRGRLSGDAGERAAPAAGTAGVPDVLAAARRAIKARDRLGAFDWTDDRTAAVVRWLDQEMVGLLSDLHVTVLSDAGEVDPLRHEVVDVRSSANADDVDRIAETVRVGYLADGRLIRPQQVVAYVAAESER
jgi:molecular chaperone GrpE (heat shock protein)